MLFISISRILTTYVPFNLQEIIEEKRISTFFMLSFILALIQKSHIKKLKEILQ